MPPPQLDALCAANLRRAKPAVRRPAFAPDALGVGIAHLGLGAFHRAHQAVYTDDALASEGGDWRITGVGMRSTQTADALTAQDGLYTVIERGPGAAAPRVVGSLKETLNLARDRAAVEARLRAPLTKIITLTVTEKAYRRDPKTGRLDVDAADVAQDLATPNAPATVPGLLAHALKQRRDGEAGGVAVLSCDNLADNGAALRAVVLDFIDQAYPEILTWVEDHVRFPSSMVDRITPRADAGDRAEAQDATGLRDAAPVVCEPFRQWVLEDDFVRGRPRWEAGGARFVGDVAPYERMKLRMLNGAHSLLAYAGHVAGCATIGACLAVPSLRALCRVYLDEAGAALPPIAALDYAGYARTVVSRFENERIRHLTAQIAADGSEKIPVRIFAGAENALEQRGPIRTFAFATALWFRYLLGRTEAGATYTLHDPREDEIRAAITPDARSGEFVDRLLKVDGLLPTRLFATPRWRDEVDAALDAVLTRGVEKAAADVVEGRPG